MRANRSLCALFTLLVLLQLALCANQPLHARDESSAPASSAPTSAHESSTVTRPSEGPSSAPPRSSATTTTHRATTSVPSESSSPSAFLDQPLKNGTAGDKDPLPLTPKLTPGLGIAGVVLLASGATYCVVGIRSKWLYVFGSAAYLSSLAVVVLICYLMNPPVTDAVQGAYFIAAFFTGGIIGALALIFKEITEGLGCLLGGFCLAMWFLVLKPDGLIGSQGGKAIFIGVMSLAAFALSFSHYTRNHGLMVCTAFAGSTAAVLGMDCFARAGLKEFWLWLWQLNSNAFPLNTDHYPQTRGIRAEIAGIVLICCFGIISQLKLWKLVKERRRRKDADRMEHEEKLERLDAEVGRRVVRQSERELVRWEAAYGDKAAKEQPYVSVREMDSTTDTLEMSRLSGSRSGSGSGESTAPTSWHGSAEHTRHLSCVDEEDEIRQAPRAAGAPDDRQTERLSGPTSRSGSVKTSHGEPRGGYLEEGASLRASMVPPPPMITLPFNPATGTLDATREEDDEAATTAGLLEEPTLSRRLSKRLSGGIRKSSSFRSARSSLSDRRKSASEQDLLVPHDDDRRSSVAATLDMLDGDQLSLRSQSDAGDGPVTHVRPATANHEDADHAGLTSLEGLRSAPAGMLAPSTEPKSALASESGSKRLSGVSVAEDDDDEALRPAVAAPAQSRASSEPPEPPAAELVADHLPDKLSKIALSYRTNEWAKHLEAAEAPDLEDLPEPESPGVQVDPSFAAATRRQSAAEHADNIGGSSSNAGPTPAAPAVIQADGVKAAALPQTGPNTLGPSVQRATPTTTLAPQLGRNASSTSINRQRASMHTDPNLLQAVSRSASAAGNPHKKMKRTSSMPLVDEESATQQWQQQQRFASRHMLPAAQDDMPLSQRRQQIRASASASASALALASASASAATPGSAAKRRSSTGALQQQQAQLQPTPPPPPAAPPNFDSHQPQRGPSHVDPSRREAMLAHWRQSLRADPLHQAQAQAQSPQQGAGPGQAGDGGDRRAAMMLEKKRGETRRREEEAQRGAAERERDGLMRSGGMLDAHREAMRRMQAETRRRSGL